MALHRSTRDTSSAFEPGRSWRESLLESPTHLPQKLIMSYDRDGDSAFPAFGDTTAGHVRVLALLKHPAGGVMGGDLDILRLGKQLG